MAQWIVAKKLNEVEKKVLCKMSHKKMYALVVGIFNS